jgi:alpha-L-arabinofuranosidase
VQGTVNVDKPKVSSGSDTYPLDVVAALTADRKALTVAVVNPTESSQQLGASFAGVTLGGGGKSWQVAPASLAAQNEAGKPMAVNIAEGTVAGAPSNITVPPLSITIYELPVQ